MKKLDMRGFSHEILVVAFVVVFAIAGVAYMVGSHADSCSPSSPVTGATIPAQGSCGHTVIGCTFQNLPATATLSQLLKHKPSVVVTNYGPAKAKFRVDTFLDIYTVGSTTPTSGNSYFTQSLAVRHHSTHKLNSRLLAGGLSNLGSNDNHVVFRVMINQTQKACEKSMTVTPTKKV